MRATSRRLAGATADYLGVLDKHFSPAVARAPKGNNIVVDHAKGCWITDIHGRKYLDFQTGIGVVSTGHCHPRFVRLPASAVQRSSGSCAGPFMMGDGASRWK